MQITAAAMLAWLALQGYPEPQREAVLEMARVESGLRPGIVSKAGDAGLFQHRGPRRRALEAYARSTGQHWTDPMAQLEFMDRELRAMAIASAFFAATTHAEAAGIFCRHYERRRRCP